MKKIIIAIPTGFEKPEDMEMGQPFEALAKVCITKDGKMEIISIEGADLAEDDKEKESEGEPAAASTDEASFMSKVMSDPRMSQAMA